MNLIQLLTDQRAYEVITHSRWGASWNWLWRRVGDDEERRSPSPEPQTDSRSGLPMKNRRWCRLRLVKRDNSFSLIFFLEICDFIASVSTSTGHQVGTTHLGAPGGGHTLVGCAHPGAPLRWFLAPEILIYWIKNPCKVSFQSENFFFCTKNNTMVVLLKTTSVRG